METNAVNTSIGRYLGLSTAAAALALFAYGAQAQEKKAAPAPAPKAEKKAACNTLKAQAGCEARTDCNWVGEAKDAKGKVTKKAYCRANPTAKKADADTKKTDTKKTDAKKDAKK
jgi:hypothetical protein